MQVRPYHNRQRDTKSQGKEERAESPGQRTGRKTIRPNALGVLETKRIISTRKAPKKQQLAATGAHPEKEMAFHPGSIIREPSIFVKKKIKIAIISTKEKKKKEKASRYSLNLPSDR